MGVESLAEPFLELVGLASNLRLRLEKCLDSEDEQLDLVGIIHRGPHRGRGKVIAGDNDRPYLHASEQALWMTYREVADGLLQDRTAWRDDREIANPVLSEVLDEGGQDVGLAYAGRHVDDRLHGWRPPVEIEVTVDREDDAFQRLFVRLTQI